MNVEEARELLTKAKAEGTLNVPTIVGKDGKDITVEFHVAMAMLSNLLAKATTLKELLRAARHGVDDYIWRRVSRAELVATLQSISPDAELAEY